jgi:hypothetical protein
VNAGTIYIVAALIFGFGLPFLKNHLHEWWEVGGVAAIYFLLVRVVIYFAEKRNKQRQ